MQLVLILDRPEQSRFFGIYSRLIKKLKHHEFFIFHSNEYNIKKEFGRYIKRKIC